MISWLAVYTRPQSEGKALENLVRQGYRAYLPRYRTQVSHARRRQSVLRPLFPRYLFAGLDRQSMPWRPILSTVGVADLVRLGERPIPVAEEIVNHLRESEARGTFDRLFVKCSLRLGDLVRINAGVFEDVVGRLVELRDQDRVVVLLDLLGRTVCAQLDAKVLEIA